MTPLPRLSICIPTHNFGAFIGATLDSILLDCPDQIEIIVLDCGSTDATMEVVAERQAVAANLVYHHRQVKGGIDRDMAFAVELANAPYCWLFSADDIMYPGAIERVLWEIASGEDIYLLTHADSLLDLTIIRDAHPVFAGSTDTSFNLGNAPDRRRYFESALTTEAFFSFMSGLCFKVDRWRSVPLDERYVGSCWAHAARFLGMARHGLRVRFIDAPLLNRRGDNDSFAGHGLVRRYALAIDGYNRIADDIFGEASAEAFHIRRVLRAEFKLAYLLHAKSRTVSQAGFEDRAQLDRLVASLLKDRTWSNFWNMAIYRAVPVFAYDRLRSIVRRLRRSAPNTAAA